MYLIDKYLLHGYQHHCGKSNVFFKYPSVLPCQRTGHACGLLTLGVTWDWLSPVPKTDPCKANHFKDYVFLPFLSFSPYMTSNAQTHLPRQAMSKMKASLAESEQRTDLCFVSLSDFEAIYSLVRAKSLSCVWLCVTPWTVARQGPLSMGFSRQQYWSGLPSPSPEGSSQLSLSCLILREPNIFSRIILSWQWLLFLKERKGHSLLFRLMNIISTKTLSQGEQKRD